MAAPVKLGRAESVRRTALPIALVAAAISFASVVARHQPISDWLVLRYAGYWILTALFVAACLSSGHALVRWILGGRVLPLFEHVGAAAAAGVYLFFLGSLCAGLLGWYGRVFFFALPLSLIAAGARPSLRFARRAGRHLRGAWRRSPRSSPWGALVHAFGLFGLAAVYFATLTPDNAAFDARWYHLGIAEHYTAEGAVRPFPEGWILGTYPHLASLLYTWAFQLPSARLFDRIELAAHLEMSLFVLSLLGIAALVRRLVRPREAGGAYRYAWAVRFLFPGVFLYDSSLCLGADHVAALFASPIYATLLRTWPTLSPRASVLLSLVLAGALLSKYTGALILVAPPVVLVGARALVLALRALRRREPGGIRSALGGPLAALATGLVFTAPHWLKNLLWYGDPVYPVLHKLVRERPWTADSSPRFDVAFAATQIWPEERTVAGLGRALAVLPTFSFAPHDWERFHGQVPVFGSLFTLCLVALPFLRGTRRVWGLYLATHLGIFVWYWVNHQDRYLQAALPWMSAATTAVLALTWRQGLLARLGAALLLAVQVAWGTVVCFMPAHVFLGVPAKAVIDLWSQKPGKPAGDRLVFSDPFVAVGNALPPKSKVLIHEFHPHLGVNAPSVTDCPLHQGGISYLRTPTPGEVYEQLHGFGVTHLVYRTTQPREPDTLAGEIVFFNFVQRYAGPPKAAEGWLVAAMPSLPPPPLGAPDPVLVVSCGKGLPAGLYRLADLAIPSLDKTSPAPRPVAESSARALPDLVPAAMAVAQDQGCPALPAGVDASFVRAGTRDPYLIWVRR
jgi:hypothetical protein